jgi:LysM domain-containing protein
MKKFKTAAVLVSLAGLLACGCAAKKIDTTDVPKSPENAQVVVVPTPMPVETQKYVVKKGDTLWAISHQTGIYADSFEWPLIFKADRDQIQDPDQINVGQVLLIQQGQTTDQVQHAIKLASDTPKFVPHVEARQPLPIDYF